MSDYGKILMSTANAVGASLKKKMGSLTGFAPVDWAETINKLGNKLPERTVSGAVCSFSDGADDVPMPSVKASITAVQAGSGDPSPSNVRAISGFAECDVYHSKKNMFHADSSDFPMSENGIACPSVSSGNKNTILWDGPLPLGKWTINENAPNASNSTHQLVLSKNGTTLRYITTDPYTLTVDNEEDSYRVRLYVYPNNAETYVKPQLERGDTATTYESYAGETIPVWMGGKNLWYLDDISATKSKNVNVNIPKGSYMFSAVITSSDTDGTQNLIVFAYKDGTNLAFRITRGSSRVSRELTLADDVVSVTFYAGYNSSQSSGDTFSFTDIQIELGDTATTYEPVRYIYGGELNLTTGVLTVTHGYIASYNGETIGEPWISSIDKYVAGNSPSTGAQVVYPLTTPTAIQLTPEEVRSFLGTNNLWANTGDSEVTYFAQPNIPTEVLHKGQISTTSDYATANFSETVADDEEILVKVYCPARSAVDYKVIKVSDIGNGLNVGFSLHTTVNCTITKTSIASYQYSGDYYDIYADVLAYNSAIFN